jgi:hypothetical protein
MIDAVTFFIKSSLCGVSSLPVGDYHAQTMNRSYCRTLKYQDFRNGIWGISKPFSPLMVQRYQQNMAMSIFGIFNEPTKVVLQLRGQEIGEIHEEIWLALWSFEVMDFERTGIQADGI